ncbi:ATP synthase subunit b [Spirochaetia bacterium]|nr:ATP synthase subunit b [Spirochaetia bacterium]
MITPSLATFLITIINIGILFFILRAILFKPVTKFMEDRTKKIEDAIAQSEKARLESQELLRQYEDRLKKAEGDADAIIRSARETAQQQSEKIVAEGKAAAEKFLANGRTQLETEQKAAMAMFKTEAAALVVSAAAKLIQRELNQDDNRRLAGLLLQELGK